MNCPAHLDGPSRLSCQNPAPHGPTGGHLYLSTDVDDRHTRTDSEVE